MKQKDKLVQEWILKASDDEAYARILFHEKDLAPWGVGSHLHQMTEKYLKAFLVARGQKFPKIHHLGRLLALCAELESDFDDFKSIAPKLNSYYLTSRYPGSVPEPSWKEIEGVFEQVERIKEFILEKIQLV